MAERASIVLLAGIVLTGVLEIVHLRRQLRLLRSSAPTKAPHLRVVVGH